MFSLSTFDNNENIDESLKLMFDPIVKSIISELE